MAFEALLKLAAMLALGIYVVGLPTTPSAIDLVRPQAGDLSGFAPLVLLGVLAMFTLPHQFHVGAVECRDERHVLRARWLFPLYLLLIALPVLPLARAGDALLAGRGVPSDLYVLALPLSQGNDALALLAFQCQSFEPPRSGAQLYLSPQVAPMALSKTLKSLPNACSLLPTTNGARVMLSTPPATTTSASPQVMA